MIKLQNKKNINRIIIALVSIAVVVVGINFIFTKDTNKIGVISQNGEWKTYTNEFFHFEISFPSDWKIYENFETVNPVVNIYKPEFKNPNPPYDYFSNVSSILIFPNGTEMAVTVGKNREAQIDTNSKLALESDSIIEYLLQDNSIWAKKINFNKTPESWRDWGFIGSVLKIENRKTECLKKGIIINIEDCNPFGGDVLTTSGNVDSEISEIQMKILESFRFVGN